MTLTATFNYKLVFLGERLLTEILQGLYAYVIVDKVKQHGLRHDSLLNSN